MTSQSPRAVMIFAAGFGTRMGDLTKDRPKSLLQVGGRALIDYALDFAHQVDASRIVANLHYKAEQLERHLAPQSVICVHEDPMILETGGGLKAARAALGGSPVWTLNSDAIWAGPNPLQVLLDAWDPTAMDALLIGIDRRRAISHPGKGDFIVQPDGSVTRGPGLIYGGAQIIKTEMLDAVGEDVFSLNLVWDNALAAGRLTVLPYPGDWCDVGTPEGLQAAEALLESRGV